MQTVRSVCAYCGADNTPLQREHVVAKAFWSGNRPSRTVTVPACTKCEGEFKNEESYFRNTIVALAGDEHPEARALLEGKMGRAIRRNPRELADITRGLQHGFRRNVASGLYEPASKFDLNIPRFSRCIEKIVRGLFFHTRERPLNTAYEVAVRMGNGFWHDPLIEPLIKEMGPFAGYGDSDTVFAARTVKDNADPDVSAWVFVFYKSVGFFAMTWPK